MNEKNKKIPIFRIPKFLQAVNKVFLNNNIRTQEQDIITNIIKNWSEGRISVFNLANEMSEQAKLDLNQAIKITTEIRSAFDAFVPLESRIKVNKWSELWAKLPTLPAVKPVRIEDLNSNYSQSKVWLLAENKLPNYPQFSDTRYLPLTAKEIDETMAKEPELDAKDFIYGSGNLSNSEEKEIKLTVKLKNKGLSEFKAAALARDLLKFIEDRQKYLAGQKVLHRDTLAELKLIKIANNDAQNFILPKEVEATLNLKVSIDALILKAAIFKLKNILFAYQKKLLLSNAKLNNNKLEYYLKVLNNAAELLEEKELNQEILIKIREVAINLTGAILAGLLFERIN